MEIAGMLLGGIDPFEIRTLVSSFLSDHSYLVEPSRLTRKAAVLIALRLNFRDNGADLDSWLREQIQSAWNQVFSEDDENHQEFSRDEFGHLDPEECWGFAAEIFEVPPVVACRLCVSFNHLPSASRRAFFAHLIEQKDLAQIAASEGLAVEQVEANFKVALATIQRSINEGMAQEGLQ